MPKYVIEREIPGAGRLSEEELRQASENSCNVLRGMGPEIQWLESYIADDKVFCVYVAQDEEMVMEHARRAGLPADRINRVSRVTDPTTAEAHAA